MTGTDYTHVEQKLRAAGYFTDEAYGETIASSVLELFAVLDGQGLDLHDRETVASLFAALAKGDFELGDRATGRSEWHPFFLGDNAYGSVVRVRTDAYSTPVGRRHNGLTGVFTAAHGGRAYITYHGRRLGGAHEHAPDRLEVLRRLPASS